MNVAKILTDAGYSITEDVSSIASPNGKLCSGFRVFPDGEKCPGCYDCKELAKRSDQAEEYLDEHAGRRV